MTPITRKTLLRLLLAISLYSKGHTAAAWYCLPKKYKRYFLVSAGGILGILNALMFSRGSTEDAVSGIVRVDLRPKRYAA